MPSASRGDMGMRRLQSRVQEAKISEGEGNEVYISDPGAGEGHPCGVEQSPGSEIKLSFKPPSFAFTL